MFDISLVRILPTHPKVPFMKLRYFAIAVSLTLILASLVLDGTKKLNFGIDFVGGSVLTYDLGPDADIDRLRPVIGDLGFGEPTIQNIDSGPTSENTYPWVRIGIKAQPEVEGASQNAQQAAIAKVEAAIKEVFPTATNQGIDSVGSKVSGELQKKGIWSVVIALTMVVIYIWIRFEWQFAVGAVLALVHDVLLTIGMFALTQIEFNLAIVAAILTIVGYSLNDTVIVYDRIRENLRKYKKTPLVEVLNMSINDTLSRTIMTSLTTLLALLALYVFGGEGLRGFSFAMLWGVFIGTYSSIFIAAPLLLVLKLKRGGAMTTGKEVSTRN